MKSDAHVVLDIIFRLYFDKENFLREQDKKETKEHTPKNRAYHVSLRFDQLTLVKLLNSDEVLHKVVKNTLRKLFLNENSKLINNHY
jgi:hypothetical protein